MSAGCSSRESVRAVKQPARTLRHPPTVAAARRCRRANLLVSGTGVEAWPLARRISQPVLAVVGADSGPAARESHALLRRWLPQAEPFVLKGATHGLRFQNPRGMAEALAAFLARHPVPAMTPA